MFDGLTRYNKIEHDRKAAFEIGLRSVVISDGIDVGELIRSSRAGRFFRAGDKSSLSIIYSSTPSIGKSFSTAKKMRSSSL